MKRSTRAEEVPGSDQVSADFDPCLAEFDQAPPDLAHKLSGARAAGIRLAFGLRSTMAGVGARPVGVSRGVAQGNLYRMSSIRNLALLPMPRVPQAGPNRFGKPNIDFVAKVEPETPVFAKP